MVMLVYQYFWYFRLVDIYMKYIYYQIHHLYSSNLWVAFIFITFLIFFFFAFLCKKFCIKIAGGKKKI